MAKKYSNQEVERFLVALEEQARGIIALSEKAAAEANKHSYELYNKFRSKVSEFETFSIIIEARLRNMDGKRASELQEKFDQLSVLMFSHFIKASIKFFFVLSASTLLPLGARDIFMAELKRIYEAKNKLQNPKFESAIDDEIAMNLDLAEDILNEIIEKAPRLLDLAVSESRAGTDQHSELPEEAKAS
jgi:hypothetical protein